MSTVVIQENIRIPNHVDDLDSFCQWACSEEYPERGRYSFLNGEVWVGLTPERIYIHNQVKGEYAVVLGNLCRSEKLGRFFHDRTLLRNTKANLSTEPDGTFASWASLRTKRVRVVRVSQGYDILVGTPDMALEVVSDTSEHKDTVRLPQLYCKAGILSLYQASKSFSSALGRACCGRIYRRE